MTHVFTTITTKCIRTLLYHNVRVTCALMQSLGKFENVFFFHVAYHILFYYIYDEI